MGAALAGYNGDVWVSASPGIQLGAIELATDAGDHINYAMATHHYWDRSHVVAFEYSPNGSSGWVAVPVTDYSFNYCGGLLVFAVARTPGANNFIRMTTSGWYLNTAQVTDCSDWTLDISGDVQDTTTFQTAAGWRTNTATVKKGAAKVSSFKPDGTFTSILNGLMVLVLYTNKSANSRWESYAYLVGVSVKTSATGVITEEASFTLEGQTAFYTS